MERQNNANARRGTDAVPPKRAAEGTYSASLGAAEESPAGVTFRGVKWLLLFVFYLQFLVPVFLEWCWSKVSAQPLPEEVYMIAVQLFAVALPCAVFLYLYSAKPPETLGLRKITAEQGVVCVLLGAAAQPLASLLNIPALLYIGAKTGGLPEAAVGTPQNAAQLAIALAVVALLPAIFEELLMRGIVLTATRNNGYRASLLIGGLYFALLHNQAENIAGHLFLGILLCYLVWMTRSVFAGMLAHFSFNAFGMLLDYAVSVKSSAYPFLGGGVFQWSVTAVCAVLFFLLSGTVHRKRIKRNRSRALPLQMIRSLANFPVLLMIGGYILFQYVRYFNL
ncbi:MAG: CPBP family intramembrane metalloprotease [Clostridiales bacterium]|jgi:membrane protease YdiL (CAAX protease family)|nr:CPBP family intramembrane metalloprotease [Clostridiales bacterium]